MRLKVLFDREEARRAARLSVINRHIIFTFPIALSDNGKGKDRVLNDLLVTAQLFVFQMHNKRSLTHFNPAQLFAIFAFK